MAGSTGSPGSTTGTALLLAASPVGKGCLVDAASVLPVLAAVAPAVLAGTDTANVVELADPLEPQAVLTRLRAAAVTPGPLTVFLTGQLQLDRKQHLPHLALARTTPATVRYTAFPWHWIAEELRLRAPGTTTLFLDLHADAAAWQYVTGRAFAAGRGVSVYGRVAPPPPRRAVAVPTYMKTVATILRSGHRPAAGQLHQQALGRLSSEGAAYGDVVLAWDALAGAAAGSAGPVSPPPPLPVPSVPGGSAPRPPVRAERARPQTPDGLEMRTGAQQAPDGLEMPAGAEQAPDGLEMWAGAEQAPDGPGMPTGAEESPRRAGAGNGTDPHSFITSAVQAGQHGDADAFAAQWEQAAFREHGPGSEEALHWTEVRADLAMFAGDPARSCRAWLTVAGTRLSAGQAPDAPAVEAAVDRAHHQWTSLGESADARELGPVVVELRRRVPGRREGAVRHAERQLERLGEPARPARAARTAQHVPG
ncbi:hypothetical protein ACKI1I_02420 [Streptomyces turgidiscabies]|uniref:Uncharacterized protein n=1 Tax=Streptomyces turgidiscabies (strain Car8) TaxID=698760 RepID=L7FIY6_STRT8|nr:MULTISPECIES: hypothetical protein [Streptomyces]ELP71297.1 hypothetical protein STRTUCAR8_05436 [Streptomyces turgidiscabies Car8]MDX3492248.1 hypothetical protein [Streptomyces turgidiscabies]GAQ69461.1 hypothetical protein T45_01186 [Streptomyces turgidiscabies]